MNQNHAVSKKKADLFHWGELIFSPHSFLFPKTLFDGWRKIMALMSKVRIFNVLFLEGAPAEKRNWKVRTTTAKRKYMSSCMQERPLIVWLFLDHTIDNEKTGPLQSGRKIMGCPCLPRARRDQSIPRTTAGRTANEATIFRPTRRGAWCEVSLFERRE